MPWYFSEVRGNSKGAAVRKISEILQEVFVSMALMILPLLSALSFFAGVLVASFSDYRVGQWTWPLLLLIFVKKRPLAIFVFAFCLGVLRMTTYEDGMVSDFSVGEADLAGEVVEEVDVRSDHKKITVDTLAGRVLVKLSLYEDVAFGDHVKLSGSLEKPAMSDSYANYLFRYGISFTMDKPHIEVVKPAELSVRGVLYHFKDWVQRRINCLYFEPDASLVSGLLLGSRKGMSEELTLAFQTTGLTHIVAVSGYNISLVIACIFSVCGFLPMKRRTILSVIMVAAFVLFVGASAAAVRAGLMGSLSMWGLYTGRRSQAFFALLWSAVLMTLWNPAILPFDIGFQLSFTSTLGLLVFSPMLEKCIPWGSGFIKEALLLTLSAQIATFPFIVFYFGRLSLISPLANVVVAPFLPLSMLFSGLSLVAGPFALIASVYTKVVILSVRWLSKVPHADMELTFSLQAFLLTLLGLTFWALLFYRSKLARAFGLGGGELVSKA